MTDTLQQEITDAITKHLPAQTADALRDRLDEVDNLEAKCADRKERISGLLVEQNKWVDREQALLNDIERLKEEISKLNERKAWIEDTEKNLMDKLLEYKTAEIRVQEAQKSTASLFALVETLFQNKSEALRHHFNLSGNIPIAGESYAPTHHFDAHVSGGTEPKKGK